MRVPSLIVLVIAASGARAQPAPADDSAQPGPAASADSAAAPPLPAVVPAPVGIEPPPLPPAVVDAAPADAPPALRVVYDRGISFSSADGGFALRVALRNQLRFESSRSMGDGAQFASHFLIPRSRLQVEGHVFGKATRYKLELGLGDAGSFAFVKDLYLDQRLGHGPAWFRAGVWKRPFNRQELVADFASEFNERANTATFAGGGRDLGIGVHNDFERSPEGLEWAAGVFNGFSGGADRPQQTTTCTENAATGAITCTTPAPTNFPADFGPALVARIGWNVGPIKGYTEGDLDGGPLRLAIGASYKIDLANLAPQEEASVADNLSHGVQADAMLKVAGFSAQAGVYLMKLKTADAGTGAFVQVGYVVVPQRIQLAGRLAYAPPAPQLTREQLEARVAFNLFWQGHAFKWATDLGVLKLTGEDPVTMTTDEPELQLRSMLQLTL